MIDYDLLTRLGARRICNFIYILEGKAGGETPEPSRYEFWQKIFANNLALCSGKEKTSRRLNCGRIADFV